MKAQSFFIPILSAFLGGLLAIAITRYAVNEPLVMSDTTAQDTPVAVRKTSFPGGLGEVTDFTFAAEKTVNAVVHVKTVFTREGETLSYGNPLFDYFFGPQLRQRQGEPRPSVGSGSGVIISPDGYIITNNHVVERFDEIEVTLNDKRTFSATLVGRDPSTDLALLKIAAEDLPSIPFGNSEDLRVGQWVLAVGNPFNLNSTVTAGIVSAKARNINILRDNYAIESFIQTDAAVNPGNSGGALVNLNGELVGINTAIASRTGSFAGYSFAVPSTIARKVAMDIIEFGEVQRALLGVTIRDLNPEIAKQNNIRELRGVLVDGVSPGGAAEEAGIKPGDVILEVNGFAVNSPNQLQEQISKYRPKEKVEIVINRNNKRETFSATLRNMIGGFEVVRASNASEILGVELRPADSKTLSKLGISNGLQVVKLGEGRLKEAGVKQNFIIIRLNRTPVRSVDDVNRLLANHKGGVLVEGIYPNGTVAYYAIGL